MGHTYTQLPAPQTCVGVTGASTAVGRLHFNNITVAFVSVVYIFKRFDTTENIIYADLINNYCSCLFCCVEYRYVVRCDLRKRQRLLSIFHSAKFDYAPANAGNIDIS